MKTLATLAITAYTLVLSCSPALASSPTPTPHPDHKHGNTDRAERPSSAATLNAELQKPVGRPNDTQAVRPLFDTDRGGLDDMGSVGGDYEE